MIDRRWRALAVVGALLAGGLTACGGDAKPPAPLSVDLSLAPKDVPGRLKLYENRDDKTRKAFANAGEASLFDDGRLWELRRKDRLYGTFQISTVDQRVDLTDADNRDDIARQVVSAGSRVRIEDVEIYTVTIQDRSIYVWFGRHLTEILTLKGLDEAKPEDVVKSILQHQLRQKAWEPLPPDAADLRGADLGSESP